MSYTLTIEDTDKLRYVMGRLRGRPSVTSFNGFNVPNSEHSPTTVLCLHTATDGNQTLILCLAESDYVACTTLDGRVQFFRAFRRVILDLHPETTALFDS